MKIDPPIGICGGGVVLPEEQPRAMASLAGREWPVRRVDLNRPELARWQPELRLRRASGLTTFMLAAAQQALAAAGPVNPATLGIVSAFHTGVLVATGKFYQGIVKNGQRFASPNLFPETVFNSPTSHVAAVLGASGPSYSVLADESAWVTALGVAACWLATGLVEHALVLAGEELDPMALDAYAAVRWLRHARPFVPAEGAGAVVLRRARVEDRVRLTGLAEGFTHRNRAQAHVAARALLAEFAGVTAVARTATGTWWNGIETELIGRMAVELPNRGAAFVATAAWQTVDAVARVRAAGGELLVPVWGLSAQCSALLVAGQSAK